MNVKMIASWVLAVLIALAFASAALGKLSAQPMMIATFASFGYPVWFMYLTGAIELVSAILVLVPRTAGIGAALLVCVMLGALFAHLSHGQAGRAGAPAVLLVLTLIFGTLRNWRGVPIGSAPAST